MQSQPSKTDFKIYVESWVNAEFLDELSKYE